MLFDIVHFKGNNTDFWLSFAKTGLLWSCFRHEAERSSSGHEATNSNTSLVEKVNISTCQLCVSAGYGVREKKPYSPYSLLEISGECKDINKHSKMPPRGTMH